MSRAPLTARHRGYVSSKALLSTSKGWVVMDVLLAGCRGASNLNPHEAERTSDLGLSLRSPPWCLPGGGRETAQRRPRTRTEQGEE